MPYATVTRHLPAPKPIQIHEMKEGQFACLLHPDNPRFQRGVVKCHGMGPMGPVIYEIETDHPITVSAMYPQSVCLLQPGDEIRITI